MKNIIILTNGTHFETWGSLTEICKEYGFSHNYLKKKKFPFFYKGIKFIKTPFKTKNEHLLPNGELKQGINPTLHTLSDPLILNWDGMQYRVNKPNIDREELVSLSVAEELASRV
jgi:hypothetical protein